MPRKKETVSVEKKAMRKASERTAAAKTRAIKKDAEEEHIATLHTLLAKVSHNRQKIFSKDKAFRKNWEEAFVLSPEKIADIALTAYNASAEKDLDSSIEFAFDLDEKLGRKCTAKSFDIKNSLAASVRESIFKGKASMAFKDALPLVLGDNPPSRTIWGKSVRTPIDLFRHLYFVVRFIELANDFTGENAESCKSEFLEEPKFSQYMKAFDKHCQYIIRGDVYAELFHSLMHAFIFDFDDYCKGKDAFAERLYKNSMPF